MHHFHFGDVRPDEDASVAGEQVRAFRCCFGQGFIAASNNTLLRSQIHKHQIFLNEKLLKCLKVVPWVRLPLHCENFIFFCAHVPALRRLFLVTPLRLEASLSQFAYSECERANRSGHV